MFGESVTYDNGYVVTSKKSLVAQNVQQSKETRDFPKPDKERKLITLTH